MEEIKYPTEHIVCTPEEIAETVLMPGDPMRSLYIAENFLKDPVLFNNVRGVQGYTGYFEGKRVSVMASGMGMPAIGIYSYELYNFFGVENIIRIGTCGGLRADMNVGKIVLAMGASTDSNYCENLVPYGHFAPLADFGLLKVAERKAVEAGLDIKVGNILSSDIFYSSKESHWEDYGVLAVEMEAAALYTNAAAAGKKALAICTVSNNLVTGESTTALQRERSLDDMILLGLNVAKEI